MNDAIYYSLIVPILVYTIGIGYSVRNYGLQNFYMLPSLLSHLIKCIASIFFYKKINKNFLHIFIMTFVYELQQILLITYSRKLPPAVSTVCIQSKFIFFCIFSFIMLKRKYTKLQFSALIVILIGIMYTAFFQQDNTTKKFTLLPCLATVTSSLCAGFANVYFEKYIRKSVTNFFGFQLVYEAFSCICCVGFMSVELSCRDVCVKSNFYDKYLYVIVFLNIIGPVLISYFSTKVCVVKRTLLTTAVSICGSLIAQKILGNAIYAYNYVSFIIVVVGILMYEYVNIIKLLKRNK